ncbi:hypothetical protein KR038_008449 [Drosophila bunnanda]|nr:hypothetical protein KR038_008449 [Drosophila bunnanda]
MVDSHRMSSCLCRLVIFLCFIVLSKQQETRGTPSFTTAVPSGKTQVTAATKAPRNELQSIKQAAGSAIPLGSSPAGGSQCQAHELLSKNGCVDKDDRLNQVKMRSSKDEGFEKDKEAIGVVDVSNCKADEVKTPFGCERAVVKKPRNDLRVPVQHNMEVMNLNRRRRFANSEAEGKERIYKNGRNRPRQHYILPGRRLRTGRSCLPYEVLSRGGKCVRKKGKKGVYEHKNHVYGLQQRHRHQSSEKEANKDNNK